MSVPLVCANNVLTSLGRTAENPLPMREIVAPTPSAKITQALWGPLNKYIIYSSEDCSVYIHDPEVRVLLLQRTAMARVLTSLSLSLQHLTKPQSGELLHTITDHQAQVNSIAFSWDETYFITSSDDRTARVSQQATSLSTQREIEASTLTFFFYFFHYFYLLLSSSSSSSTTQLYDSKTFKLLKTFESAKPVNSAAISPILDHVLLGGGQKAHGVTTSAAEAGGFEARIYDMIFEEELGSIKGHFGPINTISYAPDGKR